METDVGESYDFEKKRPITKGHRDLKCNALATELKFIIHFVTDGWGCEFENVPIEGENLFKLFEVFCGPSHSSTKTPNAIGFGTKVKGTLHKLGLFSTGDEPVKAFHRNRNSNSCTDSCTVWRIDRRAAFEGLKHFTDYDTFESLPAGISYYSLNTADGLGTSFLAKKINGTFV